MQQQTGPARVVAVVPTFKPPEDLRVRLGALATEVHAVVVTDDGSGPGSAALLQDLHENGAHVVHSTRNTGIAAALNRGIAEARRLDPTHIITVDQDSTLDAGYSAAALEAFDALHEAGAKVLAVGAGVIDGHPMPADASFAGFPRIYDTLQSGLLFDAAILELVGPFDEALFIDCVDTDILLRGAVKGFDTYLSRDCRLMHQLGDTIEARLLGKRLVFAYHGPLRRYYITRNRAVVEARFAQHFPGWAAEQLRNQSRFFLYCLVFGPHRLRQLLAASAGLADALRGRRGPISRQLAGLLGAT